jgi:chromosomal replication initiator protein
MKRFPIEDGVTSAERLWAEVVDALKSRITARAYETWFSETRPVALQDQRLIVEVPNEFYIDWLEEHYSPIIKTILKELGKPKLTVIFRPQQKKMGAVEREQSVTPPPLSRLSRKYTFENFVVGKSNEFAYAAAKAVASSPATQYNPLFLYGGVGLGKTHLLQAIGNEIRKRNRSLKVYYTPAENFMNEMIKAIQKRSMVNFKYKYRQLDVLLIDDIHFLADKEMLQEEIFHTFNSLYDAGKQIVMTSDRPPKEIPSLEKRLVSRFEWGLVVDIRPPDLETRIAILRHKVEEERIDIQPFVINYIAKRVKDNVRELVGCLNRIVAYISMTGKSVSAEEVKEILRDIIKTSPGVTIDQVVEMVATYFDVRESEIRGNSRRSNILLARQVAMYLSRNVLGLSLTKIGNYFSRDHSTVIHALRKVENLLKTDEELVQKVAEIKEKLSST